MIEVVHPAPYLDTVALLNGSTAIKPQVHRLACYQVAHTDAVAFVDDGRTLAVIGFWPLGDGFDEVFLVGRSAEEIGPRLLQLSRLARLTLAARLHSGTEGVIGFVRIGHEPGRRLARLSGFVLGDGAPSGFERWELLRDGEIRPGSDGRRRV